MQCQPTLCLPLYNWTFGYGSEIYAPYPYRDIEKVHLKSCEYLLSLPSGASIIWYMVNSGGYH